MQGHEAEERGVLPVAVIGGGFSGCAAAIQILRRQPASHVLLCDSGPGFGQGVAYSSAASPYTLLNVPAHNMSLYPDEPGHFTQWLGEQGSGVAEFLADSPTGVFATRQLYGRYVGDELRRIASLAGNESRLTLVRDRVVDLAPEGAGFEVRCADGRSYDVAAAVLAAGNLPPPAKAGTRHVQAWAQAALEGLAPDRPVAVIGTGLTMVDVAAILDRQGFKGPIIAISRRGLLPQTHQPSRPWATPEFSPGESRSTLRLYQRIRREITEAQAREVGWRGVIDSLRPITQKMWLDLPLEERRRFLRHVRAWWDVHRHRMPAPAAATIERMVAQGRLVIRRGRVMGVVEDDAEATITFRTRGEAQPEALRVQRVIDATGLASVAHARDPLIERLTERGLLTFDTLGMGIAVDADLNCVGRDGTPARNLRALGPIVRGIFWECIAVPDVRKQAQQIGIGR